MSDWIELKEGDSLPASDVYAIRFVLNGNTFEFDNYYPNGAGFHRMLASPDLNHLSRVDRSLVTHYKFSKTIEDFYEEN